MKEACDNVSQLPSLSKFPIEDAGRDAARSRWQSRCRSRRVLGLAELVALLSEVPKVGDDVTSLGYAANCFVKFSRSQLPSSIVSGPTNQPEDIPITRPLTKRLRSQSDPFPPSTAAHRLQVMGRGAVCV